MEIFSHSQLGTPPSSWQSTQLITLWKQALSFIAAWKTKWDSSWEGNQLSPSSGPRTLDQPPGSGASHLGHSGLQSLTFIHRSTVLDRGPPMGILGPSSASHQTQHGGRHSPKHSNRPHVPSLQSALQTSHAPAFLSLISLTSSPWGCYAPLLMLHHLLKNPSPKDGPPCFLPSSEASSTVGWSGSNNSCFISRWERERAMIAG